MDDYYDDHRATIHRGVYPLAAEATDAVRGRARARRRVRRLDAPARPSSPRNATEAINLVAYAWGRANVGAGDLVARHRDGAPLQHRAVADARAASRRELDYVAVDDDGLLDLDALDALLAARRRSSSPSRTSPTCSARSTRSPRSSARAHAAGAVVAGRRRAGRAAACRSTSRALDADFYAWTGHKAYGPTGIGVLHGRRELLEAMPPFLGGGHMIARVGDYESTLGRAAGEVRGRHDRRSPRRSASAPPSTCCRGIGMDAVRAHERDVAGYALERLAEVAGPARSTARATLDAARRARLVRARRHPPARRRRDPRPRGRLRPRRPPLRAAADAPPRRRRPRRARRSPCTPRARTSTALVDGLATVREVFA